MFVNVTRDHRRRIPITQEMRDVDGRSTALQGRLHALLCRTSLAPYANYVQGEGILHLIKIFVRENMRENDDYLMLLLLCVAHSVIRDNM